MALIIKIILITMLNKTKIKGNDEFSRAEKSKFRIIKI